MAKHVVKVTKDRNNFRINIPREAVKLKGWESVTHVLLETHWGDRLIIRRLLDDKNREA